MVCWAFTTVIEYVTAGAAAYSSFPAWVNVSRQSPGRVITTPPVARSPVHAPSTAMATGSPELAVATGA